MSHRLDPRDVTNAITSLTDEHGHPPTLRELADELGVSVSGAHWWLRRLREGGYVDWRDGASRTVKVLR